MDKLKKLMELRAMLLRELEAMVDALNTETEKDGKKVAEIRAFTAEEQKLYDEKRAKIEELNATIKSLSEARALEITEPVDDKPVIPEDKTEEKRAADEERGFVEYIRSRAEGTEIRADSNWTPAENGAVIPTTIANKIIEKVRDISPIFSLVTKYTIGGTLTIPYYDESNGSITVELADEFTEGESTSGRFASITLTGYLARVTTKVSKKLMIDSKFDILNYVIGKIAEAVALWLDNVLINGIAGKIDGLTKAKNVITANSATAITSDELMSLQDQLPDIFQNNAVWIMSREARSAIRKLKDGQGRYLLNEDLTAKWGYVLFGNPVYTTENIRFEPGAPAIYYGDFSGLAMKMSESFSLDVLREKYLEQHAVGVVGWLEVDAKIENDQKIAVLKMKE